MFYSFYQRSSQRLVITSGSRKSSACNRVTAIDPRSTDRLRSCCLQTGQGFAQVFILCAGTGLNCFVTTNWDCRAMGMDI